MEFCGDGESFTARANFLCKYFDVTFITRGQGDRPDYFTLDKSIHRIDIPESVSYIDALRNVLLENRYDITVATGGIESHFYIRLKMEVRRYMNFTFLMKCLRYGRKI